VPAIHTGRGVVALELLEFLEAFDAEKARWGQQDIGMGARIAGARDYLEAVGYVEESINCDNLRGCRTAGLPHGGGKIHELLFQIGDVGERWRSLRSGLFRKEHGVGPCRASRSEHAVALGGQGWPAMKSAKHPDKYNQLVSVTVRAFQSCAEIDHRNRRPRWGWRTDENIITVCARAVTTADFEFHRAEFGFLSGHNTHGQNPTLKSACSRDDHVFSQLHR